MIAILAAYAVVGILLITFGSRLGRRAFVIGFLPHVLVLAWLIPRLGEIIDGEVQTDHLMWVPELGLAFDEKRGISADRNGQTSVPGVYVVGRSARPGRSQAIISAGDGAAVAIDILSREKGEDYVDWDEPPKDKAS